MGLQHIDIGAVLHRLAERRIEEAMEQGKFDHLPGAGKPLALEPLPADENTRLLWWSLRILRKNDVVPDEVHWRKTVEMLRSNLATVTDECVLESLVRQINDLVRKLNTLGTNAIPSQVVPVDLEQERTRLRQRVETR